MKSFKQLTIIDPKNDKSTLIKFLDYLKASKNENWSYNESLTLDYGKNISKDSNEVCCFEGVGELVDTARIWLVLWGRKVKVANIVPINKRNLSYEEYNNILDYFNDALVLPNAKKLLLDVITSPAETDVRDAIGTEVFEKLSEWAYTCNKNSGNVHELDFLKWAAFLTTAFSKESKLTSQLLERILKEEFNWNDIDLIDKLCEDYEYGIDLLKYYARNKSY